MSNRRYVVLFGGELHWTSRLDEAERLYASVEHARMEVWENKNDWNSAKFIKKK